MAFNNYTDDELIERAKQLVSKGGLSGGTLEFLEDLVWNGLDQEDERYNFDISRLEQILLLHGV